jgi:ketosteroid isomerase-like protein
MPPPNCATLQVMSYGLSSEEIEWIRDGYRMFREGDPAFMDRFAPDAECRFPVTLPAGGTYDSPFEALEFWTTMSEVFDSPYADPEEFLRVGDRLVVLGTWRARSRQTGEEIAARFVHVYGLSGDEASAIDQKAVSFEVLADTAALLQSLGNPPPAPG